MGKITLRKNRKRMYCIVQGKAFVKNLLKIHLHYIGRKKRNNIQKIYLPFKIIVV